MRTVISGFLAIAAVISVRAATDGPGIDGMDNRGLGISSWAGWTPGQISKADNPHLRTVPLILHWDDLEPNRDDYRFEEIVGSRLTEADNGGLYVMMTIWVRPNYPDWLNTELGVPIVQTDITTDPLGGGANPYHLYYFDPEYKREFFELIDAFGAYVQTIPQHLRKRILFHQSAEGSTGDGGPYKGDPLDSQYDISKDDWNVFRRETWVRYQTVLPGVPILVNVDANTEEENNWLLDKMDIIALKYGMFSHGWNISDGLERLADFRALETLAKARGKEVLTRGEQDAEINVYTWGTRNPALALYWGGLYATHNQLDLWNVPADNLKDPSSFEICRFFNRYAGLHDAADSPRAFCALHEGLNSADGVRFPSGTFGSVTKDNEQRYVDIATAFSTYGARMEDPAAATGGGMINRKRDGYNDAGWNILTNNFSRFLTQINPGSGDVSWWHVNVMKKGSSYAVASKYSRFARGFENASGKNSMYFDLSDDLADKLTVVPNDVVVKVIYFDEVAGSTWALQYDNGSGMSSVAVTNSGSGDWKTLEVALADAAFQNGGPNGADLALVNTDSFDDIFHMIEVELNAAPAFSSNPIIRSGAVAGALYENTLAGSAVDMNGDTVEYSFVPGGPTWLSVSSDGAIFGTPGTGDVGLNSWTVQVDDGGGVQDIAELLMVVNEQPTAGWFELLYDDFENGWGNWASGGGDAFLSGDYALGTQCLDIQNFNGAASSAYLSPPRDFTAYSQLKLEFSYYAKSIDVSGEGFALEISTDGGSTWSTAKYFALDTDFVNNVRENPVLLLDDAIYGFSANTVLRFRCDSGGVVDDIYIDNVRISGLVPGNLPPAFMSDPLAMPNAGIQAVYHERIAAKASDPEDDPLLFSKISGPAWLNILADGTIYGVPQTVELGNNLWCIKVEDGHSNSDYALMTIQVREDAGTGTVIPAHDPVLFSATFTGSQPNTNAFNNSSPVSDPFGGIANLNAGTSTGSWTAVSLEESSVYLNANGNPVLFAGTGAYELTANLEQPALISDRIDISLDFAVCRLGNTDTRRNFVTGLDGSGNRVFRIWLSGNGLDDGGRTLYIETPGATSLLATNIARSAGDGFADASLDRLDVRIDETGIAVALNASEKTNGVPVSSAGATSLSKIVFEGESTWYGNILVVSAGSVSSAYTVWQNQYALSGGQVGDDDFDGVLNLAEFGLGGNPTNPADRGYSPVLQMGGDSIRLIHPCRSGATYTLETCDNLISNSWTNAVYTLIGYEPSIGDLGFVTNRLDEPLSDEKFIRLHIGL